MTARVMVTVTVMKIKFSVKKKHARMNHNYTTRYASNTELFAVYVSFLCVAFALPFFASNVLAFIAIPCKHLNRNYNLCLLFYVFVVKPYARLFSIAKQRNSENSQPRLLRSMIFLSCMHSAHGTYVLYIE